jgi:chloride channel 3/4/5
MPAAYRPLQDDIVYEEDQYELTEDGRVPIPYPKVATYRDGHSIDWIHEENLERERIYALKSQAGARGILLPTLESAKMWFIVIMTGMGIGIAGAWLDVLVKW